MLLQILDFIRREHVASTQQIAREFSIEEQALLPMLEIWENRGLIRCSGTSAGCKANCFGCRLETLIFYEFIGKYPLDLPLNKK
ncbi:FeoC-like transcriptional regulator [Legionella londiniensis]|uniref:FeoC like transcriptional regulator n=1 Tax=Legionella londiniensis TaxID=45068 RepID=A0A0W0VST8_9GAMM|nr:FeoC-like transcriptional regulator [Legionella londiniensis]KTD23037.1 FeoC like transcriptional regulator [Legionella londiniensis]STX94054.1 FeoC like transcriptional regulator [Legionella londiniensis]